MTTVVRFLDFHTPGQLDAISTVGSSSWLGSWWAGLKYKANAIGVMREGYKKVTLDASQVSCKLNEIPARISTVQGRKHVLLDGRYQQS